MLFANLDPSIQGKKVSMDSYFSLLAAPPLQEGCLSVCRSSLWYLAHTEKDNILGLSFLLKRQHYRFTDQLQRGERSGSADPTQIAFMSAVAISCCLVSSKCLA